MKTPKNLIQITIAALSVFLLSGVVIFTWNAASQVGTADLFGLQDEVEQFTGSLNYETRIATGDSYYKSGYYTLAATEFAYAINIEDGNPEAYIKLGDTHMALDNYPEAVQQYMKANELKANDTETIVKYGIALLRNKDFDFAYETLNALGNSNQKALLYTAILESYFGDHDSAEKKYSEAAGMSGSIPYSNIEEYITAYNEYNAQQGGQIIYLDALLVKAMIDMEEYQIAEELALKAINDKPDYRDLWILLGYSELKTEQYEEAEDAFIQAKSLDSTKPETHYFLATTYYSQEKYEDAVKEYELALLYGFSEDEVYRKMAESYLFLERYEESLEAYEYILKVDPSMDDYVRPIWIAIDVLADLDRALTLSEEAVTNFPEDAMSHNLLAWTYIEKGELESAATEIDTAFAIDPDLAEAHYNAGLLRIAEGLPEGAKWEFKKAYELSESGDNINEKAAQQYNTLILEYPEE